MPALARGFVVGSAFLVVFGIAVIVAFSKDGTK